MDRIENHNNSLNNENENSLELFSNINFPQNLTNDSYAYLLQDNTFIVFNSLDIIFLIYASENKSIVAYNLIDSRKIIEIKNAHKNYITNFRHYLDEINKINLIISISAQDNNIKIWNIINFECLINLEKVYIEGILSSGIIIKENSQYYIVISNFNVWDSEPIKVFDFKGNKIREINEDNSNDKTFFIDAYYDNFLSKNFLITGNWGSVKSYDFNKNKIYHKYCDNDNRSHYNIIINKDNEIIKLIESGSDCKIRIWNFHSGLLMNIIKVCEMGLRSICLWNNYYLFAGYNKNITIIDLKHEKIIKDITCPNYVINTIKTIIHPKYGRCLISQGLKNEQIKLWIFKN